MFLPTQSCMSAGVYSERQVIDLICNRVDVRDFGQVGSLQETPFRVSIV